ncbi:hypothetical protein OS493_018947 [Desmophyllum pertusum]|uniref:Uncharacterized protein n=1 Tax=Desmophyllum pertusum TaxID=174260 RepID=A0A9W9YZS1_9CNID|nr:hypothetical protein OS493_018947 [Desmophyllum pertusum]
MNHSDMYFVEEDIPKNESDENAHVLCGDEEGGKEILSHKMAGDTKTGFQRITWLLFSLLDPKTIDMFHFSGAKHTTPNCPIEMALDFNPSGGASYWGGFKHCQRQRPSIMYLSLRTRPGTKYEEWSTNAHEGRPGHHTQVSVGKKRVEQVKNKENS